MPSNLLKSLVAVDVGNTSIKIGYFPALAAYPAPQATVNIATQRPDFSQLHQWQPAELLSGAAWYIASVHEPAAEQLVAWLAAHRLAGSIRRLDFHDSPLALQIEYPERLGLDRLMSAVAANALRPADRPAVVVDAGTAITVDVVAPPGSFLGGAILPGMAMAALALDRYTDKLPLVPTHHLENPAAIGNSTLPAIESGLFWSAVGAIRELSTRIGKELGSDPELFLTGGDARRLAPHLPQARVVPAMVLSGVALCAQWLERGEE